MISKNEVAELHNQKILEEYDKVIKNIDGQLKDSGEAFFSFEAGSNNAEKLKHDIRALANAYSRYGWTVNISEPLEVKPYCGWSIKVYGLYKFEKTILPF